MHHVIETRRWLICGIAVLALCSGCPSESSGGTDTSGAGTAVTAADDTSAGGTSPGDPWVTVVDDCAQCPAGLACVDEGGPPLCVAEPGTVVDDCADCPDGELCRLVGNVRVCSTVPATCAEDVSCDCLATTLCGACSTCELFGAEFQCVADCDRCPGACGDEG